VKKIICFSLCLFNKKTGNLNELHHTILQVSLNLSRTKNIIRTTNYLESEIQKMLNLEVNMVSSNLNVSNHYDLILYIKNKIDILIRDINKENNKESLMLEDAVNVDFIRLYNNKKNTLEYLEI